MLEMLFIGNVMLLCSIMLEMVCTYAAAFYHVGNDVYWMAVIPGFSESGHIKEAIWMFRNMRLDDVEPDSFTFGSSISVSSRINGFENNKQFHSLVVKFGLETDLFVGSAIVDMDSNCGKLMAAFKLFQSLPDRDVASWNAIICGFAQNREAAFNRMIEIKPKVEHYTCMVDILAPVGLLDEAESLILSLPITVKPDSVMWSS